MAKQKKFSKLKDPTKATDWESQETWGRIHDVVCNSPIKPYDEVLASIKQNVKLPDIKEFL